MVRRHHLIEIKGIKELTLSISSTPHHASLPPINHSIERNHGSQIASMGVLQQNPGADRTYRGQHESDAFDPDRTSRDRLGLVRRAPERPRRECGTSGDHGEACHPACGVDRAAKPFEHVADRDRTEEAGCEPSKRVWRKRGAPLCRIRSSDGAAGKRTPLDAASAKSKHTRTDFDPGGPMNWIVEAEAALLWGTAKQRETPSIINAAAEAEAVQAYNRAVDALEGRISARNMRSLTRRGLVDAWKVASGKPLLAAARAPGHISEWSPSESLDRFRKCSLALCRG
jgi:hypothetical protein